MVVFLQCTAEAGGGSGIAGDRLSLILSLGGEEVVPSVNRLCSYDQCPGGLPQRVGGIQLCVELLNHSQMPPCCLFCLSG